CAIVIVDYFLVRRGNYRVKEMIDPSGDYAYTGGVNWRAMVVWAIGVGFFLAVRNVGVFSAWIGATYPTMILTGVLYYAQHRMNAAAKIKRGEHVA
ncbi:MAG: cytosine permease, partial [Alicyclobacillaceae bacterium]|nr:cytosine permease [Alicyclobacillaceae bacterium]